MGPVAPAGLFRFVKKRRSSSGVFVGCLADNWLLVVGSIFGFPIGLKSDSLRVYTMPTDSLNNI